MLQWDDTNQEIYKETKFFTVLECGKSNIKVAAFGKKFLDVPSNSRTEDVRKNPSVPLELNPPHGWGLLA